ncbi:MAG: pseudouridine-5'-phosphate glycosidase [Granulosicoccus sp.]|nr:pseudouridine-5'-phosphate glycosidase [Granulosicoccus sp.]
MLEIQTEVQDALSGGHAVVALESTIITHGMPYPQNLETAQQVESDIRDEGAIPATIAVLDGKLRVGLNADELQKLATHKSVMKLSRADLAMAVARKATGSTTVAGTMIAAELAGIRYFATGGIGGVHRDATSTFDISADLIELSRTPVHVVCAGAKAILDIPHTLEYLETLGVPVVVYNSDEVPAFWSRHSGLPAPLRCDSVNEINRFIATRQSLGLNEAVLIMNPIPEPDEINHETINGYITTALDDAARAHISGKQVTPFLLARINELSEGSSLTANIALIRNNARLAARLACGSKG